jgi:ornithine cyclodeaminase
MTLPMLDADALTVIEAADALEAALAAGLDPETAAPRASVPVGAGELLVMPAAVGAHAAVKLVTVGPGEPRVQGVCVLFDAESLAPVALLDGIALTNLRTAAVSALAVRRLAAPDARRLLVFGRGPQGRAHADAMQAIRPIEHVDLVGREGAPDELIAAADIICCCTTAREPLFDGALVADHACVVAVGSHEPHAREVDDALARRATVVVESRTAALREAGDVIAAGLDGDALVTLPELVAGFEPRAGRPRLFKSVGMAWEDTVVAAAVFDRTSTASG